MSRQNNAQGETPVVLLTRLCEHAGRVAADDLSVLAQMHVWCESLAGMWGERAPGEPLADRASALMRRIEQVILGEADDATATLAGIAAELTDLNRLAALDGALAEDASSAQAKAAAASPMAATEPRPGDGRAGGTPPQDSARAGGGRCAGA